MQMCVAFRTSVLTFAATVLLAACARHPSEPVSALASPTSAPPAALSQRDPGASMLAAIDNAQEAITLHDAIAAGNDVGQALAFAQQMIDQISAILPSEPPSDRSSSSGGNGAGRLTALLRSFAVRVKLTSAQALLTIGNLAGADAELSAVQSQVPSRLLPQDLSLLRAAASLDLAGEDASLGIPQLRTQLLCTQVALRAYRGPGHIEDAMALASTLDHALANPPVLRALLPYQLSLWLSSVTEWAGSARW
ncbi:MAG: hypothetical protein ACREFP_21575 [Acetobacteraceae bacterium]